MRIKLINPNSSTHMSQAIEEGARAICLPDTEIVVTTSRMGPVNIECKYDEGLAVPGILQEIEDGERENGFDGYIIACFDDPGLYATREITKKPVIGIAETAIATARFLAPSFSVVSVLNRSIYMNRDLVARLGAQSFCRSIRSTGMSISQFEQDPDAGIKALKTQSQRAVLEDGAESIVLGCAGFVQFAKELQNELSVPVVEGVQPAIKCIESLIHLNYHTSKINSYCIPSKKTYTGYPQIFYGNN